MEKGNYLILYKWTGCARGLCESDSEWKIYVKHKAGTKKVMTVALVMIKENKFK